MYEQLNREKSTMTMRATTARMNGSQQAVLQRKQEPCNPEPGISNQSCGHYADNSTWLPLPYVSNATCACKETDNSPTARCVRQKLKKSMQGTSIFFKAEAVGAKTLPLPAWGAWIAGRFAPKVYKDHVAAYRECCCTSGPAPFPAWVGVSSVPLPCSVVGDSIRQYGSCHGTPGKW